MLSGHLIKSRARTCFAVDARKSRQAKLRRVAKRKTNCEMRALQMLCSNVEVDWRTGIAQMHKFKWRTMGRPFSAAPEEASSTSLWRACFQTAELTESPYSKARRFERSNMLTLRDCHVV
jgi:hypothetical protein